MQKVAIISISIKGYDFLIFVNFRHIKKMSGQAAFLAEFIH